MDLLSELLQQAGLQSRLIHLRRVPAQRALQFPCDRSMGLHVVTQGTLFVHAPGLAQPLQLAAGDIALMARGCTHLLSPQADAQALPVSSVWDDGVSGDPSAAADDPSSPTVISGAYQVWNPPLHPLFAEMPAWFVLRADTLPRLGPLALTVGLLGGELQQRELGASLALNGLLDVVFTLAMREMLNREGQATGFGVAVRDPQVRTAVDRMHSRCEHAWTLDELAREAGLSRTALAERFRVAMGDTPLSYLRTVRMQKAMQLLSETERKLEDVATLVGYQDAFSFSKVFKRTVGVSPKTFRLQDSADRNLPWRLQAR